MTKFTGNESLRPTTLEGLKRHAKRIKRDEGGSHSLALELAAQRSGYPSYYAAKVSLTGTPDRSVKQRPARFEGRIRKATASDVAAVEQWFDQEREIYNWGYIEASLTERPMFVMATEGGYPVGLLTVSEAGPEMFIVHPDYRRRSIGSQLALYAEARTKRRGNVAVRSECPNPESAALFRSLRYKGADHERAGMQATWAYKVFDRRLAKKDGEKVSVTIRLFPENRNWDKSVSHYFEHQVDGVRDGEGIIHLPHRVAFYRSPTDSSSDSVLQVVVDGALISEAKVKRSQSGALGVCRDKAGDWYIETLLPIAEGGVAR